MILFILLIIVGIIGGIVGFREVLQPAQQQRVIDQLPFMRVFKEPTPMGGIFPTIAPSTNENDALSLLDMPLDIPSPTPTQGAESAVEPTEKVQPTDWIRQPPSPSRPTRVNLLEMRLIRRKLAKRRLKARENIKTRPLPDCDVGR